MTQGSSTPSQIPYDHTETVGDAPVGEGAAVIAKNRGARPVSVSVDPLTRQLRQMYGAIAEEPIPAAIISLLERLQQH